MKSVDIEDSSGIEFLQNGYQNIIDKSFGILIPDKRANFITKTHVIINSKNTDFR